MCFSVAAVLVTALAGSATAATGETTPRVLVSVPVLEGFAQDGGRVVWANSSASCSAAVALRDLRTGRTRSLKHGACEAGFQHQMALAGDRALWAVVSESASSYHFTVQTSSPVGGVRVLGKQHTDKRRGFVPIPMAGDGETLVYANVSTTEDVVGYGYVYRANNTKIAGSFGTIAVAAAGDTFAAARIDPGGCACSQNSSGVELSPNGERVVYARRYGSDWAPDKAASIRIARTDGNGSEQILPPSVAEWTVKWSPDSESLLARASDGWVVLIDPDTAHVRRVFRGEYAAFSPDGSQILYQRDGDVGSAAVDGGATRSFGQVDRLIGWTADSTRVVFVRAGEMMSVDIATGTERRIGSFPDNGWALMSPTSEAVAYVDPKSSVLSVMPLAGGQARDLATSVSAFNWSANGQRLSYLTDSHRLHVVARDGSGAVDLGASDDLAVWSPDGAQYAFSLDTNTSAPRTFVAAGDAAPRFVAAGNRQRWSPDSQKLAVADANRNVTRIISAAGGGTEIRNVEPVIWLPDSQRLLVRVTSGADAGAIAYASTTTAALTRITEPDAAPAWIGVELRAFDTGKVLRRFTVDGVPEAVAMDRQRVAVLLHVGKRRMLDIRTRRTLRRERSLAMPNRVSISISGRWVIYASQRRIWALDVTSGHRTAIARTRGYVLDPTIEGTRVIWGEQRPGEDDALLTVTLSP